MRVLCRHGHFALFPNFAGEIAEFCRYFEVDLVRTGDFYTFPLLKEAPTHSIQGKPYLGVPAAVTFEGDPWDVMRENGFVYRISSGAIVLKSAVTGVLDVSTLGNHYLSNGFIQPGVRDKSGNQVLSYDANYNQAWLQLKISGYDYE
jgi:hypothetical protein